MPILDWIVEYRLYEFSMLIVVCTCFWRAYDAVTATWGRKQ